MSFATFTAQEVVRATGAGHRPGPGGDGPAGVCTDSRRVAPGELFVALKGERFDAHRFLAAVAEGGAWGALVEKDHPALAEVSGRLHLFEVFDTQRALGDLAAFHRLRRPAVPVVGVTGSNGKTTTKELLAAALERVFGPGLKTEGNLNNLVGVPLTLFRLAPEHRWAVVEMGMNAPGEIARLAEIAAPQVGLVTNAGPAHLEGLGSVERVAAAKGELYRGLPADAVAVVNLDDALMSAEAEAAADGGRLRRVRFGTAEGADVRLLTVAVHDGGMDFAVRLAPGLGGADVPVRLPLLGRHNAANAAAALAVVAALGGDVAAAAEGLAGARNVGRRLRRAEGPEGSVLLDDCYNANPLSMEAALATAADLARSRGGRLLAALGDMLELGASEAEMHRRLGELAARHGAARVVAFGPLSRRTAEAARAAGAPADAVLHTEDDAAAAAFLAGTAAGAATGTAAEWAGADLRPGDVVLIKGSRGMAMERIVARLEADG